MIGKTYEVAKKYDRSIVTILAGATVIATAYLSLGNKANSIVERSQCFMELKSEVRLNKAVHDEIHKAILESLERIEKKIR